MLLPLSVVGDHVVLGGAGDAVVVLEEAEITAGGDQKRKKLGRRQIAHRSFISAGRHRQRERNLGGSAEKNEVKFDSTRRANQKYKRIFTFISQAFRYHHYENAKK